MFTKEFIELAKDKRIQELRPELQLGDWYYMTVAEEFILVDEGWFEDCKKLFNNEIWLPTGDQLTREILKRCYTYNLNLECFSEHYCKKPNCQKWGISIEADNHVVNHELNREVWDEDILVAKLKLLLELL